MLARGERMSSEAGGELLQQVGRPFGRTHEETEDEEVLREAQFIYPGRPVVFPGAMAGEDLLCLPERRYEYEHVNTSEPLARDGWTPAEHNPWVGGLNMCTPYNIDIAFLTGASVSHERKLIRRGVFSSPSAVCAGADLRCLFVADSGQLWTRGGWQSREYKFDPPARMIKVDFSSISELIAGSFTSATFGEGKLVAPIDAAISNGHVFVLDYSNSSQHGRSMIKQVVMFDAQTCMHTRCFGAEILIAPSPSQRTIWRCSWATKI